MCQNMIVILPWKKKDVKSSGTLENRGWTLALFAICFLSNRCGNTLGTITHTYLLTWLNTWGANTQGKFVWSDMIKRGCNEKETKEEKKNLILFSFSALKCTATSLKCPSKHPPEEDAEEEEDRVCHRCCHECWWYIFLITRAYFEQTSSHSHLS